MHIFNKKKDNIKSFDKHNQLPLIKASICNGEQVAGFKNLSTGKFEEVMLIRNSNDLELFKSMHGIDGEIEKYTDDEAFEFHKRQSHFAKLHEISDEE